MNTQEVADKFIRLWREGRNDEAIKEFYPDGILTHDPGFLHSRKLEGENFRMNKPAYMLAYVEEFHETEISSPLVIGEYFCFRLIMNVTLKNAGRSSLNESWVFEVKNGKIIYERFFNCNTKMVVPGLDPVHV